MNSLQKVPLPAAQSAKAAPPEHAESKLIYVRIIITLLFLFCNFGWRILGRGK